MSRTQKTRGTSEGGRKEGGRGPPRTCTLTSHSILLGTPEVEVRGKQPYRENFAATSVAVCQLFPRPSHVEEEAKEAWRRLDPSSGVFSGFATYTTIITDVFVISEFLGF